VQIRHELPALPYATNALEPHLSRETLEFHHGRHHRGYIEALNRLVAGTEFENFPLVDLVRKGSGPIFNNAAQAWNHDFLWRCMTPEGGGAPPRGLRTAIEHSFGTMASLKQLFRGRAVELFGSGWVWLVHWPDDRMMVLPTRNASNPLRGGGTPLLVCDVWEHAYYLDYRNNRGRYLDAFWDVVDWSFVARNFAAAISGPHASVRPGDLSLDRRVSSICADS
jgi:Fe-Mn family superoxide dismutase